MDGDLERITESARDLVDRLVLPRTFFVYCGAVDQGAGNRTPGDSHRMVMGVKRDRGLVDIPGDDRLVTKFQDATILFANSHWFIVL